MKVIRMRGVLLWSVLLLCLLSCGKSETSNPVMTGDKEITYDISTIAYPNPERGFIHTYPVYSNGAPLVQSLLNGLRGQNISLILRVFYLDAFKTQAIDAAELALIQADLNTVRTAGLKAIVRFAYTDEGNGTDAPYDIVAQHLDQLKPIFEANKDIIAFVQAGFIGAWGEWHDSSNGLATVENERKVLTKLLSVLPAEIMVQVRTPTQKQQIFNVTSPLGKDIAYTADNRARVGHHNDCFLSGGTEYGTYNNIVAEKQFITDEALYVPVGGETCPPEAGYSPDCPEGQAQMKLLRWTYLNLDWYQPTINAWKASGCFDEFHKYLGHRLALVSATLPDEASSTLKLTISLTNKGFAPLYNKKLTSLVLKNKVSGTYYAISLDVDVRDVKPLGTLAIDKTVSLSGIPAGNYDMFLKITDQAESLKNKIEYAIRLANTDVWVEENNGMNSLKHSLKIN